MWFVDVFFIHIICSNGSFGHVVGFMGDGINDAAALHAADVGISVDTAVDVAKEACLVVHYGSPTFLW